MHLDATPPFLLFCFLLIKKNCWKICKVTHQEYKKPHHLPLQRFEIVILFPSVFPSAIKGWGSVQDGCGGNDNYTGSLWRSARTDADAVLVLMPPKGSIPVTGAWTNWATSPATGNCSIIITTTDGTFYRHLDGLERLPLCATFVIVTALLH